MAGGDALKKIVEILKKCLKALKKLEKELPEEMRPAAGGTMGSIGDFLNKLNEADPDEENAMAPQLGRAAPRPAPSATADEDEKEEEDEEVIISNERLGPNAGGDEMPGATATLNPKAELNPEVTAAQKVIEEAEIALQQGEELLAKQGQQATPGDPSQTVSQEQQSQSTPSAPALTALNQAPTPNATGTAPAQLQPTAAPSAPSQAPTPQPGPIASPATPIPAPPQPAGPGPAPTPTPSVAGQTSPPKPPGPGQAPAPNPPAPGQTGLNTSILQQQSPDQTLQPQSTSAPTFDTGLDPKDAAEDGQDGGFNVAPDKPADKKSPAPKPPGPDEQGKKKDKNKNTPQPRSPKDGPQLRPDGE